MTTKRIVIRGFIIATVAVSGAAWAGLFSNQAAPEAAQKARADIVAGEQVRRAERPVRTAPPARRAVDTSRFYNPAPEPVIQAEPLEVEHPLWLLPPDTVFVTWTDNLDSVIGELGVAEVLLRHRELLAEVDHALAEIGMDLMDLVDPSGLGLDPSGPAAVALLSPDRPVVIATAAIVSPELTEQAIETLTSSMVTTFRSELMNDAQVIIEDRDRPRLAFVRRSGYLYVVSADHYLSDVAMAVAQIAWQEPDAGLPTTEAWNEVVRHVPSELGRVFVNGPALYASVTMDLRRRIDETRLQSGDAELDSFAQDYIERLEAESAFLEAFFGSLGGIAFGMELEHGRIGAGGRVALAPDSLLRGLFRSRTRDSALQRAMDVAPVFLLDGALEPAAIRRIAELIASAEGTNLAVAMAAVKAFTGLNSDPLDLLNGELGVAVTRTEEEEHNTQEATWGVTVTVGLSDPSAAQLVLDSLSRLPPLAELAQADPATGGLIVQTPRWRSLNLAVVGDSLVVTTDRSFLERLSNGTGGLAQTYEKHALSNLLRSVRDIGMMVFDFDIFRSACSPSPASKSPPLETEDDRLRAEIDQIRDEARSRQCEVGLNMAALAGEVAWSGRFDGDAIVIRGGLYTGVASARDLFTALGDGLAAIAMEEKRRDAALAKLMPQEPAERATTQTARHPRRAAHPLREPIPQKQPQEQAPPL